MPRQQFADNTKVANMLRNYIGVQKGELNRLRGDLTAYRQEAQTAFKTKVAFPRATVQVGDLPTTKEDIITGSDIDFSETTAAEPDSDYEPSSANESELMAKAGAGAGRLTEPEGMTTDTERKVSFPMDTDPEMDLPPRQKGRKSGQKIWRC